MIQLYNLSSEISRYLSTDKKVETRLINMPRITRATQRMTRSLMLWK
jgi:hypothetical protein